MDKTIKQLWLIGLLVAGLVIGQATSAQVLIKNILIGTPNDGKVSVTWTTDQPAKTDLYFGQKSTSLTEHIGGVNYKMSHQAELTGLKKKTDYYYKIVVTDEAGQRTESFVQYFSTKDMKDTVAPSIGNLRVVQAIDKAAALYILSDEPSRIEINYGLEQSTLNRRASDSSLRQDHLVILDNLNPGSKYYFQAIIKDEDNNRSENGGSFTTESYNNYDQLVVNNLVPASSNQAPLLPERAVISWDSNVLATADINYGTDPNKLSQSLRVSDTHRLSHRAEIANLKPDTTYYFKIKMSSNLNHKNLESQVYSLKTAPLTFDYLIQFFRSGDLLKYRNEYYYLYNHSVVKLNANSLDYFGYPKESAKNIEEKYFSKYSTGVPYWGIFHDGQVVKESRSTTVYVIDGQYRRPVANWSIFKYLNYRSSDVVADTSGWLRSYKEGALINHSKELTGKCPVKNNSLVKAPNSGTVYLVINNHKLPFAHQRAFSRYGFKASDIKIVQWGILNQIPDGQVII